MHTSTPGVEQANGVWIWLGNYSTAHVLISIFFWTGHSVVGLWFGSENPVAYAILWQDHHPYDLMAVTWPLPRAAALKLRRIPPSLRTWNGCGVRSRSLSKILRHDETPCWWLIHFFNSNIFYIHIFYIDINKRVCISLYLFNRCNQHCLTSLSDSSKNIIKDRSRRAVKPRLEPWPQDGSRERV